MFTVSVETSFRASHQLTLPDGSKEPLHEHNWLVTVDVSSEKLNDIGLVIDFHRLRNMLKKNTSELDNTMLEKVKYFQQAGSSAEYVAKYIYDKLEQQLPSGVKLEAVRIVEEPGCSVKFSK